MNNSIKDLVESIVKNTLVEKTNQRVDGYISSLNSKTDELKDNINEIKDYIHETYNF